MTDFKKLSKDELESLGRKYGLELDRRILKGKMVKQLEDHIASLDKDELEAIGREQGVELDKRRAKDTLVKELADLDEPKSLVQLKEEIIEEDAAESVYDRWPTDKQIRIYFDGRGPTHKEIYEAVEKGLL